MGKCSCCGNIASELYICQDCGESTCDDCLVSGNETRVVDFTRCVCCDDYIECMRDFNDNF